MCALGARYLNVNHVNRQIRQIALSLDGMVTCYESEPQILYLVDGIIHDVGYGFHNDIRHEHDNDRLDSWIPAEAFGRVGNRICSGFADKPAGHTLCEKTGEQTCL